MSKVFSVIPSVTMSTNLTQLLDNPDSDEELAVLTHYLKQSPIIESVSTCRYRLTCHVNLLNISTLQSLQDLEAGVKQQMSAALGSTRAWFALLKSMTAELDTRLDARVAAGDVDYCCRTFATLAHEEATALLREVACSLLTVVKGNAVLAPDVLVSFWEADNAKDTRAADFDRLLV